MKTEILENFHSCQAFHPPDKFIWFNFFNSHAFHGDKADAVLQNFLINSEKLVVIIDPPFGAKTELIWESLARLKKRAEMLSYSVTISFLWVFPYFMEKQVCYRIWVLFPSYLYWILGDLCCP